MFSACRNHSTKKCYENKVATYFKILILKFKFDNKIFIFYPF